MLSYTTQSGKTVTYSETTEVKKGDILYANKSKRGKWNDKIGAYIMISHCNQTLETISRKGA